MIPNSNTETAALPCVGLAALVRCGHLPAQGPAPVDAKSQRWRLLSATRFLWGRAASTGVKGQGFVTVLMQSSSTAAAAAASGWPLLLLLLLCWLTG